MLGTWISPYGRNNINPDLSEACRPVYAFFAEEGCMTKKEGMNIFLDT
jgi:hypothetical protein